MTSDPDRPETQNARAVLVSVQLPGVSDEELHASLDELERLAKTLGLRAIARLTQRRHSAASAVVLGKGKLLELAQLTGGTGSVPAGATRRHKGARPTEEPEFEAEAEPDAGEKTDDDRALSHISPTEAEQAAVVLFDHDLSPSQLRNLEAATAAGVFDRSSVILAIFQRHARTREARLQVELARLSYLAPRLREARGGGDRQRGGIGGKGAGESALELDRRRIRDRIAELREELAELQRDLEVRRDRRGALNTVALVGYTNAGKSSLMRALTGSDVLVKDQLFATLDTTTHTLLPLTLPRILVSDTVGFIKKLPHDLIASFHSTLEEARSASLLLHVVDGSDAAWRSQLKVRRVVLGELGAGATPSLVLFNKADRLDPQACQALAAELPEALLMSAFRPADVTALHNRIVDFFEREMIEAQLFVSYRDQRLVHTVHQACRVLEEVPEEEGTRLRVRASAQLLDDLRGMIEQSGNDRD
jgi:GTPase